MGWSFFQYRFKALLVLLLFVVGSSWALFDDFRHASRIALHFSGEPIDSKEIVATGRVDSFPIVDGDRWRFYMKMEKIEIENNMMDMGERIWVNVRLLSQEEQQFVLQVKRGDRIALPLRMSTPTSPTNPGAFDFPRYLWQNYTSYQALGEGVSNLEVLSPSYQKWWGIATDIRSFLEQRLETIFTSEISGLMKGMLLGEQREVSVQLEDVYRNTGIIHILAISGTHVMLVIGAIFAALNIMRVTRERIYEILFFFLPIYMIVTGFSPSVVRASLMGMLYVFAKRFFAIYSAWHAISIVFIGITLMYPRIIFAVGFQLSFIITLGLILFTTPLAKRIQEQLPWMNGKVASAIALTVIAQVFSFPILAVTFHQFPLVSIPVNLLLMPLYAVIIPWGYFALFLASWWPTLGKALAVPIDGTLSIIHSLLTKVIQFPYFILSISTIPIWWWGVYFFLALYLLYPYTSFLPSRRKLVITLSVIILSLPFAMKYIDQKVTITFIDVGQGDSILIQGPYQKTILIDGGGFGYRFEQDEWQKRRDPFEVGKNVVVPSLRGLGVNRIDWLVLTHGDSDHIGGLEAVVEQLSVKNVLVNGLAPTTSVEEELLALIRERDIPIYTSQIGTWVRWNKQIEWRVLAPDSNTLTYNGDNDNSIVLLLQAFGNNILFTGDVEAPAEQNLINNYKELDVDILKVAHHGSKTSSTEAFLSHTTPKFAIISVGGNNRYGHPHPDVLERLVQQQIKTLRTDELGAISITVKRDGELTYKSWKE